jgi:hypothetical protein
MKNDFEKTEDDFLKNLNAKGRFLTPDGYFEQSKNSILSKINIDTQLYLGKMEGGFSVPPNYFNQNKKAILTKITNPQAKKITLFSWKYATGIAAILIAILGLTFFIKIQNSNSLNTNFSKVTNEDMIDYLANNDVKIEWINEVKPTSQIADKGQNNNKEMEQYLMDHADEQTLLDEL